MNDEEQRAALEIQYRKQIEVISNAITVDDELANSVLVNEFRNALRRDSDEAVKLMMKVDVDDKKAMRAIQLRVVMSQYLEDLIVAIDSRHKNAAAQIRAIEEGIGYEPEN